MYKNTIFSTLGFVFIIVLVNNIPADGWATSIPRTSFAVDDSASKPGNLVLSLQWTSGYNSNTRTVYFKKFTFQNKHRSVPHIPGIFPYHSTMDFPDPEYLHLENGNGSMRMLLLVKLKVDDTSVTCECMVNESDWLNAMSSPGTPLSVWGQLIFSGVVRKVELQMVYHKDDETLYICVENLNEPVTTVTQAGN
jgi:hypothetical protein